MAEPSNERLELEFGLLGAMISLPDAASEAIQVLSEDDFSTDTLRTIYGAVRNLFGRRSPIDRMTVLQEIGNDALSEVIQRAIAIRTPRANVSLYANMLRDRARMDHIREAGQRISWASSQDEANAEIDQLNQLLVAKRQWKSVGFADAINRFCDRHGSDQKPEYLHFGIPALDKKLYCEPGDFVIIAGEPSAGKTAFAAQAAFHLAHNHRVGFFTLETSDEKLTDRIMAQLTQIPLADIKTNHLTDAQWQTVGKVATTESALALDQIPAAGMTVNDIRAYSVAHHYDVIFVDYLQIISPGNAKLSRYEQVTQISMQLHTMAQFNHIAVIALAQLGRPDRTLRKPPPPSMHDLRESGQIEQDADAVLLLYQEDRNNNTGPRMLKIGKNKEGERDVFKLDFSGPTQTFREAHVTTADIQRIARAAQKERSAEGRAEQPEQYRILDDDEPLPF